MKVGKIKLADNKKVKSYQLKKDFIKIKIHVMFWLWPRIKWKNENNQIRSFKNPKLEIDLVDYNNSNWNLIQNI